MIYLGKTQTRSSDNILRKYEYVSFCGRKAAIGISHSDIRHSVYVKLSIFECGRLSMTTHCSKEACQTDCEVVKYSQ